MKGLLIAIFITLMAAGTASAKMPLFAAKCTPGLNVDSDTAGKVYVNGKSAKIIKRPDGQYTARAERVWIDITPKGDQPPMVTYTAKDKTVGVCEILSFKAPGGEAAAGKEQPVGSASVSGLTDTQWRLVEFQSMDDATGTKRVDDPSLYTMRLNGDGTVTMRLNCNRVKGSWSAEPSSDGVSGRFKLGPLAATRALCPPPSMDETITAQAKYIRSYLLKDGKLYLSLMADGGIYVWEPDTGSASKVDVPAAPEDGGPRDWEVMRALNLREEPSTKARTIASYAPGTILDNLGCQRSEDRVWCDVQQLGGGPRGYVSAEYLKPAVSPDGSVAKGPDDSALRAGQGQFDATGTIPCAEYKGQPMGQCEFGVARAGGGYATVVVKKPDGRTRAIFFRMGKPIGADTSQADGYPEFRATKENDLNLISIGDERYEIPDAVVLGG
ncbi:MAG: SH3 domain-containing protein [Gammaproteobacteria bacterium]